MGLSAEQKSLVLIYHLKALIIQKENLFKKFSNDDRAWQRWAWIIERKFSEWNLKNINENKNDNTHTGEIKINYNLPNGD